MGLLCRCLVWHGRKCACGVCRQYSNGGVRGAHGHTPERGPQPVFLAHGPAFKEGAYLKNAKLVDVAPTLAAVLGQTLPEADGRCMTELLK